MRDQEQNREKLEEREIRFAPANTEKEHGRLYRWFDNFWYHHKWKTIIVSFFLIVFTVCTVQMCSKERKNGDVTILYAGSYNFSVESESFSAISSCLSSYLPEDYNKNGEKKTDLTYFNIYSEEQIKEFEANVDEKGDPAPVFVNRTGNANAYSQFNSYLMTGDASLLLVERWIYEEMLTTKINYMVDLTTIQAELPEGALFVGEACYGVRLGDTALYRDNPALRALPADTVLCLMGPYFMGNSSDEVEYDHRLTYMKELLEALK